MSKVVTVDVPKDLVDKVQVADVEQSARREIIVSCIERGIPLDSPSVKVYQDEYNTWYKKFQDIKGEVEREFITPRNTDTEIAKSWTLNYQQAQLTIQY